MMNCIYCSRQNLDPSAEHVVADSAGGSIKLHAEDVCKTCNNRFDKEIDRAVQKDLTPILAQHEIIGKRGNTARWATTEVVDGQERRFFVGKNEVVAAESRKLLSQKGGAYEFRATSREELEKARDEMAARNPSKIVQLSEVIERTPHLPESRTDDVDFSAPHWLRWAAKTVLNAICYTLGRDVAVRPELDDLRTIALNGGSCPPDLCFGGLGEDITSIDELPPEHRIHVFAEPDELIVQIVTFNYCGAQLRRRLGRLQKAERMIVLDAVNKRVRQDTVGKKS